MRRGRGPLYPGPGEKEAAETLADAAGLLEAHPGGLQLRMLQTMTEVAAEKNSTLIFPLPMELLRALDRIGDRKPD